jgi:acyl carrier protein
MLTGTTTRQAEIATQLRDFIAANYLFGKECTIADTDSFLDTGIIDSTGVLELVTFLQDTFGIAVEDEELITDNLDSLEKVIAYVSGKLTVPSSLSGFAGGQ